MEIKGKTQWILATAFLTLAIGAGALAVFQSCRMVFEIATYFIQNI